MYELGDQLLNQAKPVDSQTWQSQSTEGREGLGRTWELEDVCFEVAVPTNLSLMASLVRPNLPWADVHFEERTSGIPMNPPPSHEIWPFRKDGNSEHLVVGQFSHTYPERFWPKHAGHPLTNCSRGHTAEDGWDDRDYCDYRARRGVRYHYGDLTDVVKLLDRDPTTRQAYLPIWFPEDTGSIEGQRVPCSLGYQFRIRQGRLNCTYHMRSCDYLRHMRDDIYHAMRLMWWVADKWWFMPNEGVKGSRLELGTLAMTIGSLHIFDGDREFMKTHVAKLQAQESEKLMGAMA
jgi:hypothetical protein